MQERDEPIAETRIPCFRCGERPGIDCPGKPDEATLCEPCFKKRMAEERELQETHLASFLEGVHCAGGAMKARELWAVITEEDREGVRKILGEAAIERILGEQEEKRGDDMPNALVQKLRRIRSEVAHEIDPASRDGFGSLFETAVKARDALNDMLVAAGDEETARIAEKRYSLDEMMAAAKGYSGVGCPDCGKDAEVEGDHVEIDGPGARQEVTCSQCGKAWVNTYRFDIIA